MHAMDKHLKRALAAAIGSMISLTLTQGLAYQQGGHLDTVGMAAKGAVLPGAGGPALLPQEATVVAFCAQLPDQSSDMDAIVLMQAAAESSPSQTASLVDNPLTASPQATEIRRMITVQQLVHGLTGGDTSLVRSIAISSLQALATSAHKKPTPADEGSTLCALGFALHLYGDSYAHSTLDDPTKMYPTGLGHAKDLTYPDKPLCASDVNMPGHLLGHCPGARYAAWSEYWRTAEQYLGPQGASVAGDDQVRSAMTAAIARDCGENGAGASFLTRWVTMQNMAEECLEDSLTGRNHTSTGMPAPNNTNADVMRNYFSAHDSSEPCQTVVNAARAAGGPLKDASIPAFTCTDAWTTYSKVVLKYFEQSQNAGARELMNQAIPATENDVYEAIYMKNPLL